MHNAGKSAEAKADAFFREAEEMHKARQSDYPLLYSVAGFQYCEFLLDQGKFDQVRQRAENTLGIAERNG